MAPPAGAAIGRPRGPKRAWDRRELYRLATEVGDGLKYIVNVRAHTGWLIQMLVPLYDNEGQRFPEASFVDLHKELTQRFGGLTAHVRSPARGLWKSDTGDVSRDDVVIVEVISEDLDRAWWGSYRRMLEARFRQEEVLIRALSMERL